MKTISRRRSLLVASVGVATVSYVALTSCQTPTSGNLPAPPPTTEPPVVGNLPAPPPPDATPPPPEAGTDGDAAPKQELQIPADKKP